jgi:hypothetical protein
MPRKPRRRRQARRKPFDQYPPRPPSAPVKRISWGFAHKPYRRNARPDRGGWGSIGRASAGENRAVYRMRNQASGKGTRRTINRTRKRRDTRGRFR